MQSTMAWPLGLLSYPGYSVFVVGVADVDFTELQNIASKPSERHVFVVDDFDAFSTIQDNLVTFICETASSCKCKMSKILICFIISTNPKWSNRWAFFFFQSRSAENACDYCVIIEVIVLLNVFFNKYDN